MGAVMQSIPRDWRRAGAKAAAAVMALGTTALFVGATPAAAEATSENPFGSGALFTDIGASQSGYDAGDAWFLRTADDDGTGEVLLVRIEIEAAGGIEESSVCVKDEAFTGRELGSGGCSGALEQATHSPAVSTFNYEVDLGTASIGDPIFAQVHVTLANPTGDTAFAGWVEDKPFYGNFEVTPPSCPAGTTWNDDGDGMVESGECQDATTSNPTCPEGKTWTDTNGDGVMQDNECQTPASNTTCPEGKTWTDTNGDGVMQDNECLTPAPASTTTDIPRADEVAGVLIERPAAAAAGTETAAAAPAAPAAAVASNQLATAAPAVATAGLARTGTTTTLLAQGGGLLIAAGLVLVAGTKRRVRVTA